MFQSSEKREEWDARHSAAAEGDIDVGVLESMACAAVLCGTDGRILAFNRAFRTFLARELPGVPLGDLVIPEDREALADALFVGPGSRAPMRHMRMRLASGGVVPSSADLCLVSLASRAAGEAVLLGLLGPSTQEGAVGSNAKAYRDDAGAVEARDRAALLALHGGFRDMIENLSAQLSDLVVRDHPESDETLLRTALNSVHALNQVVSEILEFDLRPEELAQRELDFDFRVALREMRQRPLSLVIDPYVPSFLRGHPGLVRRVLIELMARLGPAPLDRPPVLSVQRIFEDETHVRLLLTLAASEGSRIQDVQTAASSGLRDAQMLPCRRLVSLLGGTMGHEIAEDGSIVRWVRLRLQKGKRPTGILSGTPRSLQGRKVVFAARPDMFRSELLSRAAQEGTGSVVTHSLEEVRAMFQALPVGERPADVIVVDLALPNLEAVELARWVQEEPALRGIPLLLLSELGQPGDAAWARARGFSAYLSKPFEIETALALIADLANRVDRAEAWLGPATLLTRHSVKEADEPRLRVLVVDDDPVILMAIGAAVERIGHSADLASGGSMGIGLCARNQYDLVLCDWSMPDPDGAQFVRLLRHAERVRGIARVPFVMMSIDGGDTRRSSSIEAGANTFVQKPIRIERLEQIIDCVLRGDSLSSLKVGSEASAHDAEIGETGPQQEDEMVLDMGHLDMVSLGDPALRRDMLNTFAAEVTPGVERLNEAIRTGNAKLGMAQAGSLYSLCASLGAWDCARGFDNLERSIQLGIDDQTLASFEGLIRVVDHLNGFLARTWLARPRADVTPLTGDHSVVPREFVISEEQAA